MGWDDGVRCMLMRGGTSKGAYFLAEDLPADPAERDDLLLRIMGSPDARQIDGIGGAHPLTSKVAVISRSARPDADVDYLFLQVGVDTATVSDRQNCGNLLAGVGPFAVERGLVAKAPVRIHMVNSGSVAAAAFPGADGTVDYDGRTAIAGVPGTAAAVVLAFDGTEGSATGALLPTGNVRDVIDGVTATCVDNGMPVVVVAASELGRTGYETVAELEADTELGARVQALRLAAEALRANRLRSLLTMVGVVIGVAAVVVLVVMVFLFWFSCRTGGSCRSGPPRRSAGVSRSGRRCRR